MALALKVLRQVNDSNALTTFIGVTASGNYSTNGDACSLAASNITDPNLLSPALPGQVPPVPPTVDQEAIGGYYGQLIPAAKLADFKLKFYAPGGAEVAAGAYPAAITGGTVTLKMVSPKGQ